MISFYIKENRRKFTDFQVELLYENEALNFYVYKRTTREDGESFICIERCD